MSAGVPPRLPSDVLSHWFGGNWLDLKNMSTEDSSHLMGLWFGIDGTTYQKLDAPVGAAHDASCMPFVDLIYACKKGELDELPEWRSDEGLYAKLLLCDQYSRNCFRGTSEAFAFDELAVTFARRLYEGKHHESYTSMTPFIFLATPAQHSENIKDHEMNAEIVDYFQKKFPGYEANMIASHCKDHKEVIDKFGRYPHRNAALNRESTPEEKEWLAGDIPSWAGSQIQNI